MEIPADDESAIDEYYIRKCFKNNLGLEFWLKAGGLYGFGGHRVYIIAALYIVIWVSLNPFFIMSLFKGNVVKELTIVCEGVHFSLFLTIQVLLLVTSLMNNRLGSKLFTIMGKGFYDYQNTLDEECLSFIAKTLAESKRNKAMMAKVFIGVVMCACVSITILRPISKFFLGEHHLGTPDDGFLRLLPVTLWTPFNKQSWYVILFFLIGEEIISYMTPGIIFGSTLMFICTCEDVGTQFVILGHTLKTVVRRAKGLDMAFEDALKLCFSDSIRHHLSILKFIEYFKKIIYIPMLGFLLGSTFMICISGFIFVSQEVTISSKLVFGTFLVSELMLVFLLCWCGQKIQNKSAQIFDMVYSSEWPDNMKSMKIYILIIQSMTLTPIQIKFVGLIGASFVAFSNICSSAFSYFNILLVVKKKYEETI